MSENGKLMPNLDQESTKLLNLTVLQRMDPFVEEILITAAHVTFYEFNIDLTQWSRKDVEGSLFVVKRNTQPRFQFIVMNRRNTDNLVENLLGDFEYEVQGPYLLYRNAAQEVNGIWFYNRRECEEVANLFSRILNAYSKLPPKSKVSSVKSEFEELEAVPTMAVMDGPLEPPLSTASNITDVSDEPPFVNFFSVAMTIGNDSNVARTGQPYQCSAVIPPPHPPIVPLSVPTIQGPPSPMLTSTSLISHLNTPEISNNSNQATNLVKPSSFFSPSSSALIMPPISSSMPNAPLLNHSGTLQRPYGAPLLQPFPPPTPPPSLTPTYIPTPNHGPVISREKVRDALLILVQGTLQAEATRHLNAVMEGTRAEEQEDTTAARLDRMERMIMEMAETLRQQQQPRPQPQEQQPPPPAPPLVAPDFQAEDRTITLTKEFKKMKPPTFKGGIEPMKAEAWVLGIEKLFEVFPCTDAQKVQLAAFTLEDEARRWWMLTRTIHLGLTWVRFLELFYDKYFPQSMRDKKVTEFETLRQGNKTVAEYEAQFAELARFAPHMVDTDYKKARKFEGGLRGAILDRVNMLKLPTYVDVLERAVIAEGNLASQNRISEWKGKRQSGQWSKGSSMPPNKKQNSGTSTTSAPSQGAIPVCSECGKRHRGTCQWKSGACYQCGKMGHLIRDCPQRNQRNGNRAATNSVGSAPTTNTKAPVKPNNNNKDTARQGRVFALVPGDVQNAASVVSGHTPGGSNTPPQRCHQSSGQP